MDMFYALEEAIRQELRLQSLLGERLDEAMGLANTGDWYGALEILWEILSEDPTHEKGQHLVSPERACVLFS